MTRSDGSRSPEVDVDVDNTGTTPATGVSPVPVSFECEFFDGCPLLVVLDEGGRSWTGVDDALGGRGGGGGGGGGRSGRGDSAMRQADGGKGNGIGKKKSARAGRQGQLSNRLGEAAGSEEGFWLKVGVWVCVLCASSCG